MIASPNLQAAPLLKGDWIGPKDASIIVLLHGGGMSRDSLRPMAEHLSSYQCFLPDLPGHGENQNIVFEGFEASAKAVAETLRVQNVGPVNLFGLSLGGFTALHLMAAYPGLVTSGVVSGIHPGTIRARELMKLILWATYPLMQSRRVRELSARAIGICDVTLMSNHTGKPFAAPHTIRDVGLAALNFNLSDLPGRIVARTLLLAGSREISAIVEGLNGFENGLDNSHAALVPGGYHGWCLGQPEFSAKVIDAWVAGRRLPEALDHVTH